MARKLWHLGNTTVRSPFRLKEGLIAIKNSHLEGNLHGEDQEIALRLLLGEKGIVDLGADESNSVGRKWRSALNKLGFLIPDIPTKAGFEQLEIGPIDTISPNGHRLIEADTVPAIQECFLRALAAYVIPNPSESYDFAAFSPLKYVLSIMLALEVETGSSSITNSEIAFYVESSNPSVPVGQTVKKILNYRKNRGESENKRAFDNTIRMELAENLDYTETTFNDYADTTVRYLKATGLVITNGRGIMFFDEKKLLVEQLVSDLIIAINYKDYYKGVCNGATLPTDHLESAVAAYKDVSTRAERRGIKPKRPVSGSVADINMERHRLEEKLFELHEEDYALQQEQMVAEILAYMDMFITNRRSTAKTEDGAVTIPISERPAYLEWTLWRAFLAIDNLKNKPYDARRFNVDQTFLPIGTAPGNGPDLIFEFQDFVLVVEVTLTENSRQEAAEGEPVRRHVADIMRKETNKAVYGLFLAKNIDTNTASTFQTGMWYGKDDQSMELSIVPVTLEQFKEMFQTLMGIQEKRELRIRELLDNCLVNRTTVKAPEWKNQIGLKISDFVK